MDASQTVRIALDVVMRCQAKPELWNDLWRVGWVCGVNYEAPEEDFDRVCRAHFSPFSPGEVVMFMAKPIKRAIRSAGIATPCRCAERRLRLNLASSIGSSGLHV